MALSLCDASYNRRGEGDGTRYQVSLASRKPKGAQVAAHLGADLLRARLQPCRKRRIAIAASAAEVTLCGRKRPEALKVLLSLISSDAYHIRNPAPAVSLSSLGELRSLTRDDGLMWDSASGLCT